MLQCIDVSCFLLNSKKVTLTRSIRAFQFSTEALFKVFRINIRLCAKFMPFLSYTGTLPTFGVIRDRIQITSGILLSLHYMKSF